MLSDTVEGTWWVAGGRVFAGVRQRRPSALGPSKDAWALAFLALVWGCLDSPSTLETWPPLPHLGTPQEGTTWSGLRAGGRRRYYAGYCGYS